MKQIKKALALLLVAVLLTSLLPAAALAAEDDPITMLDLMMAVYNKPEFGLSGKTSSEKMPFTDLDGLTDEQINALGVLKDAGFLDADPEDGSSHHDVPALRFAGVTFLWYAIGMPSAGESVALPYKDVTENLPYYSGISNFYGLGIITDEDMDEDGNFRPMDELTAAQMDAWFSALDKWAQDNINSQPVTRLMIVTAIYNSPMFGLSGKTSSEEKPFTDLDGLTDEQINAFGVLKDEGLMNGNADGAAAPMDPVTRSSAAVLLWLAAGGTESEDVTLPYKDIEEDAFYYEALCVLYAHGVLSEEDMDEDGNFRPDENLTFSEMGAWLGGIGAWLAASEEITPQTLAEELYSLGLLAGVDDSGENFDLERPATRAEALVMLIRLLGKEQEALEGSWSHPFQDVPPWADPYVGYAYEKELTFGISDTEYDCESFVTVNTYLTFVLRALTYSDVEDGDFSWQNPYDLATEAGILPSIVDQEQFVRGDMVVVSAVALGAALKGSEQTMAEKFVEEGVFTQEQYDAASQIHRALEELN